MPKKAEKRPPHNSLAVEFFEILERGRKKLGINKTLFADRIGVDPATIRNWGRGDTHPDYYTALAALEVIGHEKEDAEQIWESLHKKHKRVLIRHDGRRERSTSPIDRLHRDALIAEYNELRLFGPENALLSELFVWPRVQWVNPKGLRKEASLVGDLRKLLRAWLDDPNRAAKLLMGGPGSGKSSFCRAFATQLAMDDTILPILVPLQRLRYETDDPLVAVERFLSGQTELPADLAFATDGPTPVFLFDGLDELVLPETESVTSVARNFARWLGALQAAQPRAKFLITGRTTMIQAFEEHLSVKKDDLLELTGLGALGSALSAVAGQETLDLKADQRPLWWKNYSRVAGEPEEMPEVFDDVMDLTDEPLLCYLIAISGAHEQPSDLITGKEAHLYAHLVNSLWERRWGTTDANSLQNPRAGLTSALSISDFNRLLEAVAYAAWQDGSMRVATFDTFEIARDSLDLGRAWTVFERDLKDDMSGLALTFYFSRNEALDGFEFTHQTFGEFLLARLLLTTFSDICQQAQNGQDHQVLLLQWLRFVSGATLNGNTVSLLRQCAALCDPSEASAYAETARDLLQTIIDKGMPIHLVPKDDVGSGRTLLEAGTRATAAFLNCLSSLAMARDKTEPLAIAWDSQLAPIEFLSQFLTNRVADGLETLGIAGLSFAIPHPQKQRGPLKGISSGAILPGLFLSGVSLDGTSFFGANLDRSSFSGCTMLFAEFSAAQLTNADLTDCVVSNAVFAGAKLQRADFRNAELRQSDFSDVSGQDCSFLNAQLSGCSFKAADLPDGVFTEASFQDADFDGANLEGAKFDGVTQAAGLNFRNASLIEVDFTNANLEDVDFTGADITDAVFDGASLPETFDEMIIAKIDT